MIAYNANMLDAIMADMYDKFMEYGELAVTYNKPFKEKTLKQLGFFFGAIVSSIQEFLKEKGEEWSVDVIKDNLYQGCATYNPLLNKQVRQFNGDFYNVAKRLSDMNVDEANVFIDTCIFLIDKSKSFEGLVLHPSIRYSWVKNITQEQLKEINALTCPQIDREYLAHQRKQACLWCGKANISETHHLRGANIAGTGLKASDVFAIPLCSDCHRGVLHQQGINGFMKACEWITKHISIEDFCLCNYYRFKNKL